MDAPEGEKNSPKKTDVRSNKGKFALLFTDMYSNMTSMVTDPEVKKFCSYKGQKTRFFYNQLNARLRLFKSRPSLDIQKQFVSSARDEISAWLKNNGTDTATTWGGLVVTASPLVPHLRAFLVRFTEEKIQAALADPSIQTKKAKNVTPELDLVLDEKIARKVNEETKPLKKKVDNLENALAEKDKLIEEKDEKLTKTKGKLQKAHKERRQTLALNATQADEIKKLKAKLARYSLAPSASGFPPRRTKTTRTQVSLADEKKAIKAITSDLQFALICKIEEFLKQKIGEEYSKITNHKTALDLQKKLLMNRHSDQSLLIFNKDSKTLNSELNSLLLSVITEKKENSADNVPDKATNNKAARNTVIADRLGNRIFPVYLPRLRAQRKAKEARQSLSSTTTSTTTSTSTTNSPTAQLLIGM